MLMEHRLACQRRTRATVQCRVCQTKATVMLVVLYIYIISYLLIGFLSYACGRGSVHIVRALRAGDKLKAKTILLSELHIGLILAGLIVLVVSHGHGIRIAQIMLIIMLTLGIPRDWRVLRGNGRQPKQLS